MPPHLRASATHIRVLQAYSSPADPAGPGLRHDRREPSNCEPSDQVPPQGIFGFEESTSSVYRVGSERSDIVPIELVIACFRGWCKTMLGVESLLKYVAITSAIVQTPIVHGLAQVCLLKGRLRH